jgi:hypothetical protein
MGLTTGAAEAADPRYRDYFKTDLFNGIAPLQSLPDAA